MEASIGMGWIWRHAFKCGHRFHPHVFRYRYKGIVNHRFQSSSRSGRSSSEQNTRDVESSALIRNIGIIAHIDAGKTTTSERMLYYSGFSKHMGDVDSGDTVLDFMDQERDRGITINSAAVTFYWNQHKVNLIDTPGHVDFTVEVERALRVLDGAVTVLDSSAGVETQTATVWRQAAKYRIPSVIYLNKMDKKGADVHYCLQSLRDKLSLCPLLLHLPVGTENSFSGLVDLVSFDWLKWDSGLSNDGTSFARKSLTGCDHLSFYQEALAARSALIGDLAEYDEQIADLVLREVMLENISAEELQSAVRRVTLARKMVPVLCGSSLKNKGVQPLIDAIISYLPSPNDVDHTFASYYGTDLCALAFKVSHHKQRGPLTFLRIYCGCVDCGNTVFNVNQQKNERISRILQVFGDEYVDVSQAVAGNIVAVAGFKQTVTGDTITANAGVAKLASKAWRLDQLKTTGSRGQDDADEQLPVLAGVPVPDPVFFCSIELPSLAHHKQLDYALTCLQKEDPSFKVEVNQETSQTILCGMGELHLEIIHSRLLKEFGIQADLGPMQVAYRETITTHVHEVEVLDRTLGNEKHHVRVCMSVSPDHKSQQFREVDVSPSNDVAVPNLHQHHLKAINNAVRSALASGPLLGFPVTSLSVCLHEFYMQKGTSLAMVAACAVQCVSRAIRNAGPQLLEPMMKLEISTDENRLHAVLVDLAQRRSHIVHISRIHGMQVVETLTPLAELKGYATDLRTVTSGTATFSMRLSHYEKMSRIAQETAMKSVLGPSV